MKFDEGQYLEVIIVHQPSPAELLGEPPTNAEEEARKREFGDDTERFVSPTFQQPMARLLCDRCMKFIEIGKDMREQGRLRAMAWWRDMLPKAAARLESHPCGFCGGKGNLGRLPCQICSRSGTIIMRSPSKNCATCNGTGKGFLSMHLGMGGTCSFCHGLGWQFDRRGEIHKEEATAKEKRRAEGKEQLARLGKPKTFAERLGLPLEEEEEQEIPTDSQPETEGERPARREFPF